jgi:hypothetical protein
MPPTEAELLAVRFSRMKLLIERLEAVSGESAEQRELFLKLKGEIEDAKRANKPVYTR